MAEDDDVERFEHDAHAGGLPGVRDGEGNGLEAGAGGLEAGGSGGESGEVVIDEQGADRHVTPRSGSGVGCRRTSEAHAAAMARML